MDQGLVASMPSRTARNAFDKAAVPRYYSAKTASILHKYGPGPRIHFHMGLFDPSHPAPTAAVGQQVIRQRIVASQEAMLAHAARVWGVHDTPPATLLDVGCGVGGGSLYWAEEHGASVTALTNTPEHLPLIGEFVGASSAADRVAVVLGDVHEITYARRFDAAVAVESSGYMDRERLFAVMAKALKPGGWFGLEEHFLCGSEWAEFIDDYYKTRLGTLPEYLAAAEAAGFELVVNEDVTDRVAEFWVQSMAWSTMELAAHETAGESPIKRDRLTESALTHGKFFRVWRDREVETRLLQFRLRG
ncbi:methyltransferase domain-containing protein [Streptomyces pathocidini]|uniref:methyltransferase domain-containing protein n=1 Tax=Streptomyces pathocidini TaxID=1650571 RepID=UPI0033C1D6CB